MKRMMTALFVFALAGLVRVQAQVSFSPAVFTAIDDVTITIDVTGTPMAGEANAYIWIFSNPDAADGDAAKPKKDGVVNGAWGNSSEAAKLVSAGTNKWQFTFKGTDLFGLTPAQLNSLGFLLKAKDGSKQTPDYKPYKFDPLVFTPVKMRVFPAKVGTTDVVGVNFDQSLATVADEQRMTPVSAVVTLVNASGIALETKTFPLKKESATIWSAYFIPTYNFSVTAAQLAGGKFRYKFSGTIKGAGGADITVNTGEEEVVFFDLK